MIKWLSYYNQKVIRINIDDDLHKFEIINNQGIFFKNTKTNEIINLSNAKSIWWRRNGLGLNSFIKGEQQKELIKDGIDLSSLIIGKDSLLKSEKNDLVEFIYSTLYDNAKINLGTPFKFGLNRLLTLEIAKKRGLQNTKL